MAWFEALEYLLRQGVGDAEVEWQRWLSRYVTDRSKGMPLTLTEREASAFVKIVTQLSTSFSDAVAVIESTSASFNHDRFILYQLGTETSVAHPEAVARLLIHLLKNTDAEYFYDCGDAKRIYDAVQSGIDSSRAHALKEAVLRVGCTEAVGW